MNYPDLRWEKKFWKEGINTIAGIDEAGRGPLAGPVIAAAVYVPKEVIKDLLQWRDLKIIRDSKSLTPKQRKRARLLIEKYFFFGIGVSDNKIIDRLNIVNATHLAMKKAFFDLQSKIGKTVECVLVDGSITIRNWSVKQMAVPGGDISVFSISCASIVAKTERDRFMVELSSKYPAYGFEKHKGYGTKIHRENIKKFGFLPIHRKSFKLL